MTAAAIKTMRSQDITTTTTTTPSPPNRSSPQNVEGGGGGGGGGCTTTTTTNSPNWSKIQALKQRKSDLEKLLNEKNLMLQQIQRQEHQIIAGDYNYDHISRCNGAATLRRKIGTSFKMTTKNGSYITSKELGGSVGDMEKKVRQELLNASKESNAIKPISRLHKAEYELAQQKLLAINHARQQQQQQQRSTNNNIIPDPIAITLNLTKSPSLAGESATKQQQHHPTTIETSTLSASNKYGSNNSVNNNYYTSERRNSVKSQQHSPRNYDDRASTIALMKSHHRSDYDLAAANRLLIVTPQNVGGGGSGYLYENGGGGGVIRDSNGYYTQGNLKYATSPMKTNNAQHRYSTIPTASLIDALNYYPAMQQQQSEQYDDAAALFLTQFNSGSGGGRNYQQYVGDISDSVSLSPSATTIATTGPPFSPIHQQQTGLGGYWRTYGNERIWCTVDPSYDGSGGTQQNHEKSIKSNTIAATPTKSLSLGNFDILSNGSGKDEFVDKISISSMNSELNKQQKQQKEKQWLETSLDGPTMTKQQQPQHQLSASSSVSPNSTTAATYHHVHVPPLQQQQQQQQQQQHHHYNTVQQQHSHHQHLHHYRDRSKLSSQSISNPSSSSSAMRIIPKIEDQQYLSHSTSMLNSSGSDHHHHHPHNYPKKQSPTPSQQLLLVQRSSSRIAAGAGAASSTSPVPPQLLKQQQQQQQHPRSPIIANLNQQHHDTIRIESPKNMTVVQQAVFMPYKEISKPFEMSDFYKYSTKFRQKDKQQQQQQQVEVEQ